MRQLRFDAPPHHRLMVDEDECVYGGRLFEVEDDLAERLLADPHVPVTEVPEAPEAPEVEDAFEGAPETEGDPEPGEREE